MQKVFKHPLARNATTTKVRRRQGEEETLLIILTTLDLDTKAKGFSRKNFERLNEAAQSYLAEENEVTGYAIINRPKDWGG